MPEGVPFGSYVLLRRLARGGMAEVFLARQRGPEGFTRTVALKRILPHLADSDEFSAMFLEEARLAARLTHPNVVHIYEFGVAAGQYFIAMEYVDGLDLSQLLRAAARAPLPASLCARLLADALTGLHHAHTLTSDDGRPLGIVHRDVSPQNVLVSRSGVVKVVDFGIAKAADAAERTRPGVIKGKFAYLSPEQVEGRLLDARVDVWSAGVLLHQLLAGTALFDHHDPVKAMEQIRTGDIRPIAATRPDVPPELSAIVGRALAVKVAERYASASAMAHALETFLHGRELMTSLKVAETLGPFFPSIEGAASAAARGPATATAPVGSETAEDAVEAPGTQGDPQVLLGIDPREEEAAGPVTEGAAADAPPAAGLTAEVAPEQVIAVTSLLRADPTVPRPDPTVDGGLTTLVHAPAATVARPRTDWRLAGLMAAGVFAVGSLGWVIVSHTLLGRGGAAAAPLAGVVPLPATAPLAPPAPPTIAGQPAGYLTLATTPASDVFEGKTRLAKTPLSGFLLAAGTHNLELVSAGRNPMYYVVTIPAGTTVEAALTIP